MGGPRRGAGRSRGARRRRAATFGISVLALLAASAGAAAAPAGAAPSVSSIQLSTNPALYPAFSPGVADYVSRCVPGQPLTVSVQGASGATVSVADRSFRSGSFATAVTLSAGQEISVRVEEGGQVATTYYVRCLPPDFPRWTSSKSGTTQAQWYVTTGLNGSGTHYLTMFDGNGVPVWWEKPPTTAVYVGFLPDGNLAATPRNVGTGPIREYDLQGQQVRTISAVRTATGFNPETTIHDVQQLPTGDYLLIGLFARSGVDLRPIGGGSSTSINDEVVEIVTPGGTLVWTWDTYRHIGITQLDPQWDSTILASGSVRDAYHMNSVTVVGNQLLVSYRYTDAVYDITRVTKTVSWKLGGNAIPQSLSIHNDPVFAGGSHFGGQHDARFRTGNVNDVTLYDDGTQLTGRPSRAVEYTITPTNRSATLVSSVSDPAGQTSFCCGSARHLPGGDWVVGWGFTPKISELQPTGKAVFDLTLGTGQWLYRVDPIPYGVVTAAQLRAGMDAQHPYTPTTPSAPGLHLAASDGGIFSFGQSQFYGSMGGQPLNQPVVGTAAPNTGGYWEVAADGGIFAFGDAQFYGSMGGQALNQPVVGMAATPDGGGYWEVASDGGIFAFGDAQFYGSMGGQGVGIPMAGMVATPTGGGYWEIGGDGTIYAWGTARDEGSLLDHGVAVGDVVGAAGG